MARHKVNHSLGTSVRWVLLGLVGLGLLLAGLLQGTDVALFSPKGLVAGGQHKLIVYSAGVMLAFAIPTVLLFYFFAWKYRASNTKATYNPNISHGKLFIIGLWVIPIVIVMMLAGVMWPATHLLEPHKTISASTKPLTIQVIALRWKWLFIYPDQQIATVNFVQVPVNTPVQFDLTADEAPMSSFWIPHLGGQLYAMTGHVNRLNLMAYTTGDFPGRSAEINGAGFAGMKFTARASSQPDFDSWVQGVKQSAQALDTANYNHLLQPSQNNPSTFYSPVDPDLYDKMLMKYMASHNSHLEHP